MKRQAFAAFIAALVVVSSMGSVALFAGSAGAVPSGFATISDDQVTSDLPENTPMGESAKAIADAGVMVSDNRSTTEVVVTSPGRAKNLIGGGEIHGSGPISIVISDDENHAGREVALPRDEVVDALGFEPEMVRGTHEDGSWWSEEIEYDGQWMIVTVPHFSDNTITFAGSVQIGDSFANGSTVEYNISDLDSSTDPVLNLTGVVNSEWDNESASGIGLSSTESIGVGGNLAPTDGAGGDPVLKVTGHASNGSYNPVNVQGDGTTESDLRAIGDENDAAIRSAAELVPDYSGPIDTVTVDISFAAGSDYGAAVDVYIVQEGADHTYGEGTLVKENWNPDWSTGEQSIQLDTEYDVSADTRYTIDFVTASSDSDGTRDALYIAGDDSPDSTSGNEYFLNKEGSNEYTEYSWADVTVSYTSEVNNLDVGTDSGATSSFGNFSDGETKTRTLNVNQNDTELQFNGNGGGSVDYTLQMQERTETVDPGVILNDNETVQHAGTLADGETVEYTFNSSTLREGVNNITADLPSLSADAPEMQVRVDYSHDAQDSQTVAYDGEKFSERYNVSKEYASDRLNPTLTIPFAGGVTEMITLEYSVNGGSWQQLSDYTVENTTLTANLPDASAGDTIAVRANGSKVTVENGEIQVTDPTLPGEKLDSKVEVQSSSGDLILGLGSTEDASKASYIYDESWVDDAGEYATFNDDGQHLVVPTAGVGDAFRVTNIPLQIEPTTGDVTVTIDDPSSTEPSVNVGNGPQGDGHEIAYTFVDAQGGEDYILYSQTKEVVRDSGTAQSPLTLYDDDSDETLVFKLDNGSASGDSGVSNSGGGVPSVPSDPASSLPVSGTSLLGGAALLLFLGGAYRFSQSGRVDDVGSGGRSESDNRVAAVTSAAVAIPARVVASIGRAAGAVGGGVLYAASVFSPTVERIIGSRMGRYGIVAVIGSAVVYSGALSLTGDERMVVLVAGSLVGLYVMMRETGNFNTPVYAAISAAVLILSLNAMGSDFITALVSSPSFTIVVIVTALIIWQLIEGWRKQGTTEINIEADSVE